MPLGLAFGLGLALKTGLGLCTVKKGVEDRQREGAKSTEAAHKNTHTQKR